MKIILFISAIFIIFIGLTSVSVLVDAVVNGCGSARIAPYANQVLRLGGEGILIKCCNEHDACYGSCINRWDCDSDFKRCLFKSCHSQIDLKRKHLCKLDSSLMISLVDNYGGEYYHCH